jgi:hypothetical protein
VPLKAAKACGSKVGTRKLGNDNIFVDVTKYWLIVPVLFN